MILFICGGTCFLFSCSTHYKASDVKAGKKIHNLAYGIHKKNKLDAYIPAKPDSSLPVVVLIHGGSWKRGDKLMLRSVQNMLLKNNVPSININYRLLGKKIHFKEQQEDIKAAIATADSVFSNKMGHKYILLGESAGAHLALMYGYKNGQQVSKIISLSGPTNLADRAYTRSFKSLLALPILNKLTESKFKKWGEVPVAYADFSPVNNVSGVPTLMMQGGADIFVNKRHALLLDSALASRQVERKLVFIPAAGHVPRLNAYFRNRIIYPAIKEWIGVDSVKKNG